MELARLVTEFERYMTETAQVIAGSITYCRNACSWIARHVARLSIVEAGYFISGQLAEVIHPLKNLVCMRRLPVTLSCYYVEADET